MRNRPCDALEHTSEDDLVNGAEEVPVRQSHVSRGVEHRGLANARSWAVLVHLELQPQPSRNLHLCGETQQPSLLKGLDAPEVDGVPDPEIVCVATASTDADAFPQRVEQPRIRQNQSSRTSRSGLRCAGSEQMRHAPAKGLALGRDHAGPNEVPARRRGLSGPSGSDQRVSANSWSSLTRARSMAALSPRGRIGNASSAVSRDDGLVSHAFDHGAAIRP